MGLSLTCALLLLCFLASGGAGQDVYQLGAHLQHFASVRHPAGVDVGAREAARSYIKDKFREYGLEVASHSFNTSMLLNGQTTTIVGENVVGVAEGSGKGPLLLVGADYDTSLRHNPLEDNGAGVAAMLEVARNYMKETQPEGHFTRNRTVIFVAFDLNTKEYRSDSKAGRPGFYYFVHQWLWPHLNQSLLNFGGAIILDSITRFSMNPNTQHLPDGFSQCTFPEAYKKIIEDESKGNFLALFTRGTSQSKHLAQTFMDNYTKHRKAGLVRVQKMVLETAAPVTSHVLDMIDHQAHFPFWTFHPSDQPTALPALLLTDTDVYRQSSEQCPQPCTSEAFLTRQRQQAISLTCEGLINTLFELQAERRPGTSEGSNGASFVSVTATWIMIVMAALLY
ncbi:hypothetical protein O3P69_018473 [Scylla paramamosain]|uniref:Peptidase M28 domain-containing protein n=1 Tax=Scylla paramamosain TaxID=85552 RepID=A0AAW0T2F7_SCYPA